MSLVSMFGFETGDTIDLAAALSGTASIVTSPVRTGTYALRVNPGAGSTGFAHLTSQSSSASGGIQSWDLATVYIEFQFYIATTGSGEPIIDVQTSASASKMELRLNSSRQLVAYDSTGSLMATGTTALSTTTWYRLGVMVGTGASGSWEARINGSTEISGTGNLTTSNSARAKIGKVTERASSAVDFYYDDVIVDSAAFLGDVEVKIALPTANGGGGMVFTSGTGASDYTQVDDVPPSDADYVMSAAAGGAKIALFAVQDSATIGVTGTIHAVMGLVRVRDDTDLTNSLYTVLRSGTTTGLSSSISGLTTTVLSRVRLLVQDPHTTAAWTTSGFDTVEVGVQEDNAVSVRVTFACAMVAYTPAVTAVTITPSLGSVPFTGRTVSMGFSIGMPDVP